MFLQPFAFYKEVCYNMGIFDNLIEIDANGVINYLGWVGW